MMDPALVLDGALRRCGAWIVSGGTAHASREAVGDRDQAVLLAAMVRDLLAETQLAAASLDLIAVIIGPGSFTGIRAALALAHGLGLGGGIPVIGVTVGEAIVEALPPDPHRQLWIATDSRRGRVFLERRSRAESFALETLPTPDGPVAIAGDQAVPVAAILAARDFDVVLTEIRQPDAMAILRAAVKRAQGDLPQRAPQPLYIDAPEVRFPASGVRPPPS
ncbi:MAG: tRNA (adenosine(37)-N6)-threonylcarbamoyltransferase complex dimerization subunit type 1 TsaB [Acetobacteraceae bacterium]|nr:tRNA (adenosine(37)-N6)-threonylcarbamoyltransferase complex dimerization subunit type 1 TsaB [Acetobacteraceae bacterium]